MDLTACRHCFKDGGIMGEHTMEKMIEIRSKL